MPYVGPDLSSFMAQADQRWTKFMRKHCARAGERICKQSAVTFLRMEYKNKQERTHGSLINYASRSDGKTSFFLLMDSFRFVFWNMLS